MEPRFVDTSSLREYLLVLAAEDGVNPYVICEKILADNLSVLELRVIAEACFSGWAWDQLKRPHTTQLPAASEPARTVTPTFNEGKTPIRTFVDSRGIKYASPRRRDFVDAYRNRLNQAVKVGTAADNRKRLAECTAADLLWMAAYRERMAEKNLDVASQYNNLAAALNTAGVETVADLPRAVGEKILLP